MKGYKYAQSKCEQLKSRRQKPFDFNKVERPARVSPSTGTQERVVRLQGRI